MRVLSPPPHPDSAVLCNFNTYNPHYFLWVGSLFVLPLVVAALFLLLLGGKLWCRIRHMNAGYQTALVRSVVLYPMVTLLTCLPLLSVFVWVIATQNDAPATNAEAATQWMFKYDLVSYTVAWNCSQGLLNSLVFFANSGESRERWYKLLVRFWRRVCVQIAGVAPSGQEDESTSLLKNTDFLTNSEMEETIQEQFSAERRSHFIQSTNNGLGRNLQAASGSSNSPIQDRASAPHSRSSRSSTESDATATSDYSRDCSAVGSFHEI